MISQILRTLQFSYTEVESVLVMPDRLRQCVKTVTRERDVYSTQENAHTCVNERRERSPKCSERLVPRWKTVVVVAAAELGKQLVFIEIRRRPS